MATELPHTWSAWRGGRISEWKATLITRETACLSREDRAIVDTAVAGDADRLERMGERELVGECQREAYRLDPASFVTRRRKAEADRNVYVASGARRDDLADRTAARQGRCRGFRGADPGCRLSARHR